MMKKLTLSETGNNFLTELKDKSFLDQDMLDLVDDKISTAQLMVDNSELTPDGEMTEAFAKVRAHFIEEGLNEDFLRS